MNGGAPEPWRAAPPREPDGTAAAVRDETLAAPLLAAVRGYNPDADFTLLQAACDLAGEAHRGQARDNGDPYITHPIAVAEILAGYRLDDASLITALLHDVVEDTGVTRA